MKHSKRLKWHVSVVPGFVPKFLIIKRSYKSHGMKIESFLLWNTKYWNYALFYERQKILVKSWNKIFYCFLFETSTFKYKSEAMTKAALVLELEKPTSYCVQYLEWTDHCIRRLITRYTLTSLTMHFLSITPVKISVSLLV